MLPYFSSEIFISELDFNIDNHEYISKDNFTNTVRQSNITTS